MANPDVSNWGDGAKEGAKSKAYIRETKQVLEQIFRAAKRDRLVNDVIDGLKVPAAAADPVPRRSITDDERRWTLQVADKHRGGLFILIMLYCGLRPREVAALQWRDIDFETRTLHVRRAVKAGNKQGSTKTTAGIRDVPIPEYLLSRLQAASVNKTSSDLVVTNAHGDRYTKSSIRTMWEDVITNLNIAAGCRAVKRKGCRNYVLLDPPVITDLVMYDYRHTYCTDLAAAGVPLKEAQRLMGHEDISTTANIYTHYMDSIAQDTRAKIDAYHSKNQ